MSQVSVVAIPVPQGAPLVTAIDDDSPLGVSALAILRYMYALIFTYSLLVSYLVGCPWYTMLIYYVVAYLIFFLWHYQAHHLIWWIPFNTQCYQIHKKHHYEEYPPTAFFGVTGKETLSVKTTAEQTWAEYANPLGWITQHEALMHMMLVSVLVVSYVCGVSVSTLVAVSIGFLIIAVIGNYLHHSFHIQDIWLLRYQWFHELRALHYVHHLRNCKHNYGILNMSLDRLLGSFKFQ